MARCSTAANCSNGSRTSSTSPRSSSAWSPICWWPCWAAWSTPATSCWPSPATRSTPASSRSWPSALGRAQAVQARRGPEGDQRRRAAGPVRAAGAVPGPGATGDPGSEEPVKQLQEAVTELVSRVADGRHRPAEAGSAFWGQPLLRDDELRDWHHAAGSAQDLHRGPDAIQHGRQAQEPAHRRRTTSTPRRRTSRSWMRSRSCWTWSPSWAPRPPTCPRPRWCCPSDHPWVEAGPERRARRSWPSSPRRRPGPATRKHRRLPANPGAAEEGLHHRLHRQPQQGAAGRGRRQDQVRPAQGPPPAWPCAPWPASR